MGAHLVATTRDALNAQVDEVQRMLTGANLQIAKLEAALDEIKAESAGVPGLEWVVDKARKALAETAP